MDKDYLQNIAGSPYVEEGTFDRAIARGTEFGQRTLAEVGIPTKENPATIIQTKFRNFTDELKGLLRPFSEGPDSVINKLKGLTPPMTSDETNTANQLVELYNSLFKKGIFPSNIGPQTKGAIAPGILNVPPWSRERSPKKPGLMESLLKEGHRENLEVNKALATNNATEIVNAYVKAVKDIYYRFLVIVRAAVPNLQTNDAAAQSVKANLTDPRDAAAFNKVESVYKSLASSKVPPVIAPTTSPTTPTTQPKAEGEQQVANDFVALVGATIELIWKRVKKDTKHSHQYFAKPIVGGGYYLPQTWEEPHVTDPEWGHVSGSEGVTEPTYKKIGAGNLPSGYSYIPPKATPLSNISEADEPTSQEDPETGGVRRAGTSGSDKDIELSGEFVYDFASLYHKYPGKYSIEVTETPVLVDLPSGKKKEIKVFWSWDKHENTISIEVRNPGESKLEKADILRFYDDQVNPRVPGYNLNIPLFLKQVDRRMESIYGKATNKEAVTQHLNELKPSLYAIIRRKSPMEWVAKDKDSLGLKTINGTFDPTSPNYETVYRSRGDKKTRGPYPKHMIQVSYHSGTAAERLEWYNALKELGYFDKIKGFSAELEANEAKIEAAKIEVMKTGASEETAEKLIRTLIKRKVENVKLPVAALASKATAMLPGKGSIDWLPNGDVLIKAVDETGKEQITKVDKNNIKNLGIDTQKNLEAMGYWDQFPDAPKPSGLTSNIPPPETKPEPVKEPEKGKDPETLPRKFLGKMYEVPLHDQDGTVMDTVLRWETYKQGVKDYTLEQVKKMIAHPEKYPNFILALKSFPDLYKKYGGNLDEGFINPFQMANFL